MPDFFSNGFFRLGFEKMLLGEIDLLSDTIKAQLLTSAIQDLRNYEFLDDIVGTTGSAVTLAGKSTSGAKFSASDVTFTAPSGKVGAVLIYKDTGVASTSPLIALVSDSVHFPFEAHGTNVVVTWPSTGVFYFDGHDAVDGSVSTHGLYHLGAKKIMDGDIDADDDNFRALLLSTSLVDLKVDEYLDDVPSSVRVGTPVDLSGNTYDVWTLDFSDAAFAYAVGEVASMVVYKWTGTESTSPLLVHLTDVPQFPLDITGETVRVEWSVLGILGGIKEIAE